MKAFLLFSLLANFARASTLTLGPSFDLNGALGLFSTSGGASIGYGYGVGVQVDCNAIPNVRLTLIPSYKMHKMTRTIDGSGSLLDRTPARFTQTANYWGIAGLVGIPLALSKERSWWFSAGVEYLKPISGTQIDSFSVSTSFNPGRLFFLLLGASTEISGFYGSALSLHFQSFFNISDPDSPLIGARAIAAFGFDLFK